MTLEAIGDPGEPDFTGQAEEQPRRAAYTVREAAVLLGLSPGSTYALVRAGEIPALRVGGRWIVPKRRFHRWLDARSAK